MVYHTGMALVGRPRTPLAERLDLYSTPIPPSACRLWTGALDFKGYGKMGVTLERGTKQKHRGAHCVAWELAHGPIPRGFEIDHKTDEGCVGKLCTEERHMQLVTKRQNVLLAWARRRAAGWRPKHERSAA